MVISHDENLLVRFFSFQDRINDFKAFDNFRMKSSKEKGSLGTASFYDWT
jgi:hypothetical protein